MKQTLIHGLIENGWTEIKTDWEYRKNNWFILRDTSSWWMIGTDMNPRVFDISEPQEYETKWTINLIDHLCKMEDERTRLRKQLEHIQKTTNELQTSDFVKKTLEECYHSWIVDNDKLYCPICNSIKENK